MEKNCIVVNLGSSSKKYAIFANNYELCSIYLEKATAKKSYHKSIEIFCSKLKKLKYLNKAQDIGSIGFRVVAPTSYFTQHRKINESFIKKLKSAATIAPLHIEPLIDEIYQWRKIFPRAPFYGISDSAFHITLPMCARLYALPKNIRERYDIYRFGYHGISNAAVVRTLKKMCNNAIPKNIIVCHLSGGSSITAIKNGISIDTSMGFTPLEGVPMATRVGTIDAAVVMYLLKKGMTLNNVKNILFNKSGIVGLTNYVDMRKIVSLAQRGNQICLKAIDLFVYHIIKYIGAYQAILGGLDILVFTGGIGEGSPFVRSLVCQNLTEFGIIFDAQANNKIINIDSFINHKTSKTQIAVLKADEMLEIALEMNQLNFKGHHFLSDI